MTDDDLVKSIEGEFSTDELTTICDDLSLSLKINKLSNKDVINKIFEDLDKNGIPDEDLSDVLFEFLLFCEYIDDDGEIVELDEPEVEEGADDNEDVPECFSFADNRDPACRTCSIYDKCFEVRMENRPPCYGLLFDENEEECQLCIENSFCREEYKSNQGE